MLTQPTILLPVPQQKSALQTSIFNTPLQSLIWRFLESNPSEVQSYDFPEMVFDEILEYIEKAVKPEQR